MKRIERRRKLHCCLAIVMLMLCPLGGCAKKIPHFLAPEYEKRGVRLIAILPVANQSNNAEAAALFRDKVLEAVYFRGYPKIPPKTIDEKLSPFFSDYRRPTPDAVPPRQVGDLLGVDAVLYVTLKECDTSFLLLYASTGVTATFDLRSAKTNESIWSVKHSLTERNFEITRDRLRMKSCQVFEPVMEEIIAKAVETLPLGPDA
ncbi:MAG: DUF799 family lipoprotein [Pseudomonadota bacterium]|nr:DUF799 family lipoprotein [Pseudomonadota bacterium]